MNPSGLWRYISAIPGPYSHSCLRLHAFLNSGPPSLLTRTMANQRIVDIILENLDDPELVLCLFDFYSATLLFEVVRAVRSKRPKRKPKRRQCWVMPYLRQRVECGYYNTIMKELSTESPLLYRNFTRINEALFDEIVLLVTPHIRRRMTYWRRPIEPGLRVAITLRYLATGETYRSLAYQFRVAPNTISKIVPDTCRAIVAEFGDEYLHTPNTADEWKQVARGFEMRWNFPHTLGAVDGKHIRIRKPPGAGTHYFNYKKYYSIILMAMVDAEYKFLYIDVGAIGSESDGGVFAKSELAKLLQEHGMNLPPPDKLPNTPEDSPPAHYFFVGDDAFPLRHYMMKPYPSLALTHDERIFNYRLSRARRTVENAFGILANR